MGKLKHWTAEVLLIAVETSCLGLARRTDFGRRPQRHHTSASLIARETAQETEVAAPGPPRKKGAGDHYAGGQRQEQHARFPGVLDNSKRHDRSR